MNSENEQKKKRNRYERNFTQNKILYYKNIMYTDYSFSNKLLKIWKHLEICITCMKYDKSRIFPFLGKKIGEDMSIMIYQYLNPDPKINYYKIIYNLF